MVQPLQKLVEGLQSIDLFYWRSTKAEYSQIIALLTGNTVLVFMTRNMIFGFDAPGNLVACLTVFLSVIVAIPLAAIIPKPDFSGAVWLIARLISISWILSLALLAISIVPALRWFNNFESHWRTAFIYAGLSSSIIFIRSLQTALPRPTKSTAMICLLVLWGLTSTFLYYTVMDEETSAVFQDNAESLIKALGLTS